MPAGTIRSQPFAGAPAHLERLGVLVAQQLLGLRGVDAQQQPAVPARRHRHVPIDQEREPTEHLLLAVPGLMLDEVAQPVGEVLVVGHSSR